MKRMRQKNSLEIYRIAYFSFSFPCVPALKYCGTTFFINKHLWMLGGHLFLIAEMVLIMYKLVNKCANRNGNDDVLFLIDVREMKSNFLAGYSLNREK